jgi:hypothetical protein
MILLLLLFVDAIRVSLPDIFPLDHTDKSIEAQEWNIFIVRVDKKKKENT